MFIRSFWPVLTRLRAQSKIYQLGYAASLSSNTQKRLSSLTDVGVLETSFEVLDCYYHPADEG